MRKTIILPFIAVFIMAFSCEDDILDNVDVTFNTGFKELNFVADTHAAGIYNLADSVLNSDIETEVKENVGEDAELKDVRIDKAEIEVLTEGLALDVYEWIEVYISAEGISEKRIASAYSIGTNIVVISLDVDAEPLLEFLLKEKYSLRVRAKLKEDLMVPLELVLKIDYKVVARG